ncbi:MAG TPA: L-threonylcarbamoyladenylate synthase [Candidatus Nanoarchaeia archaeon]|nr:L-threonylcarbamoyladenylate synthase [Candidatus Nanoarchaeia archaeon]
MRVINKDELKHNPQLVDDIKNSVFVYPTDTIYGIGCDATNEKLVERVRQAKKSFDQPFSIIIPNKNMIYEHCVTDDKTREWADKLPGPYTLIFHVKKKFFGDNVNPKDNTIGIRIPNHWFYHYVKKMKVPIVTTSANITGQDFMTSLEDLDDEMKKKVDYVIYDGPINGRPSTTVNLAKEKVEVKKRSKPLPGLRVIKKIIKRIKK